MGISPKAKALIILIVILAVWIGGGVFLYFQVYQPSQSVKTTPYTQTTTTNTTTTPAGTTTTTPTSNLTQEEQDYIATISDHYDRTVIAITTLSNLLASTQLDSATWVSQATAQIETLKSLYDEIAELSTPYSLFTVHYNYTYAISIYKSAATSVEQAIDSQDTSPIEAAVSYINSGTNLLSEAITKLNEFIAENY